MKKRSALVALSGLMFGVGLANLPVDVHAATQYSLSQKEIDIDGQKLSKPYGIVYQNTTYMPIYYVMQLLKKFGVQTTWNGSQWSMTIPSSIDMNYTVLTSGKTGDTIVVNGHLMERVPGLVSVDPASNQSTTYMPIWYVMQLLNRFQLSSNWDGTHWRLNSSNSILSAQTTAENPNPSSSTSSGQSTSATDSGNGLTHLGQDDTAFYQRASEDIVLSAQTGNPLTGASGSSVDSIQVGQTVYLYAWQTDGQLDTSNIKWLVNSTDVKTSTDLSHRWTLTSASGSKTPAVEGFFQANQPGVYTIQAETEQGKYSVPITVIVGLSSLEQDKAVATLPAGSEGIRSFTVPAGQAPEKRLSDQAGTTFNIYPATADGWIPISGSTTANISQVQVTFGANPGQPDWSYAIPVGSDGTFQAEIRSPDSGTVQMHLFTQYVQDLTSWGNGKNSVDHPLAATISVQAPSPSANQLAGFVSAKMDINLVPDLQTVASTLYQQAGSTDSAIQAMNDYVAGSIVYDQSETQPNAYRFQDLTETWQTKLGICEDFAEMETAMLKSVGIPAMTIQGVVNDGSGATDPSIGNGDNHEWLKALVGTQWMLADPTWTSSDESSTDWMTNEFFTNTTSLQSTHQADTSQIGNPA